MLMMGALASQSILSKSLKKLRANRIVVACTIIPFENEEDEREDEGY